MHAPLPNLQLSHFVAHGQKSAGPGPAIDLAQVAERFRGPLQSYFRKRARNPEEVHDLVQEVFLRLAQHSRVENVENAEAYIFQIAANLLRDRARRESTRSGAMRELSYRTENSIEEISPERVLIAKERVEIVQRALLELPERTRLVFVLHRFEGIKYSEIALRLGISVSSVEKVMMDALRHVAVRMSKGQ